MNLQNNGSRPAPEHPPIRRSTMELEMFLPTRSEPPPAAGDASLEMSLPTRSEPPPGPASSPGPTSRPPPRSVRPPHDPTASSPRIRPADLSPFSDDPSPLASRAAGPAAGLGGGLDFELGGPSRPAAPSSPGAQPARPSAGASIRPPVAPPAGGFDVSAPEVHRPPGLQPHRAEGSDLKARLRAPLGILLLALAIATLEVGYHKVTGEDLAFGGVRPFYLAAPLALIGVGFTLWRLMGDNDDG